MDRVFQSLTGEAVSCRDAVNHSGPEGLEVSRVASLRVQKSNSDSMLGTTLNSGTLIQGVHCWLNDHNVHI